MRKLIGLFGVVAFVLGFSLLLSLGGFMYIPKSQPRVQPALLDLKEGYFIKDVFYIEYTLYGNNFLALIYLNYTYNPSYIYATAYSPEAVTAIVWDYRGLDTLFETAVFYLAIIGALALARGVLRVYKPHGNLGMSLIVKTVTRITSALIVTVAASIALHGHLTPGGGFQGGSAAAVAPLLVLTAFSLYFLFEKGVSKDLMLIIRSIGLIGIALTALSCYFIAVANGSRAFVFQNQPKFMNGSRIDVSIPSHIGGELISGTLWFFNLSEFFAVMAGFTIVFLLLFMPEEAYRGESG